MSKKTVGKITNNESESTLKVSTLYSSTMSSFYVPVETSLQCDALEPCNLYSMKQPVGSIHHIYIMRPYMISYMLTSFVPASEYHSIRAGLHISVQCDGWNVNTLL